MRGSLKGSRQNRAALRQPARASEKSEARSPTDGSSNVRRRKNPPASPRRRVSHLEGAAPSASIRPCPFPVDLGHPSRLHGGDGPSPRRAGVRAGSDVLGRKADTRLGDRGKGWDWITDAGVAL